MKINRGIQEMRNGALFRYLILSLIVISVMPFCFATVYAQNEKRIKLAPTIFPQLKFTEAKFGKEEKKFNDPFKADSEWLEKLTFTLESIAGKSIVYIQVNVIFPETRATGNVMSYALIFGQRPNTKIKSQNEPILLKPRETLEVSLAKQKDKIYKFVNERQPIQLIQEIELEIGLVVFEDKTAWNAGTFLRQDPDNPDKYLRK